MSRFDDPDSPDYQDTNVGLGMVPERKTKPAAPSADQRAPAPDVGRLLETGECYCGGKNGGHYYSCDKFDKPGYVEALEKGNEKLQARIAELEAQNVGWVTVPREPTEAIRRAFKTAEELPWPKDGDAIRQDWQHYLDAAMLAKEEGKK